MSASPPKADILDRVNAALKNVGYRPILLKKSVFYDGEKSVAI